MWEVLVQWGEGRGAKHQPDPELIFDYPHLERVARKDGRRKGLGKKAIKKRAKNIHRGGHELIFGVVIKLSR